MNPLYYFRNSKYKVNVKSVTKEASKIITVDEATVREWQRVYLFQKNHFFHPYVRIAQLMTNAALHEEASHYYLRFLEMKKDKLVHSLYLQNLLLSQSATNESLLKAHRDWAELYGNLNATKVNRSHQGLSTSGKIKIGYICHFFDNSISQNVFLPFLKLHDRSKFEVYCYDDGSAPDGYLQYVHRWVNIKSMNDHELAKMIANDGIHILQEMNGFCFINRFGALAQRPAPIQINWYNHTSTTGLPYINYAMSDIISIPDSDLPYYTESVYRNQRFNAAVHFDVDKFGATVSEAPVLKNQYITFGYFGSSHKLTLQGIHAWSEVLKRVPGSKMSLKSGTYNHTFYVNTIIEHFKKNGIDADRLIFEGWTDQVATLKKYSGIDIMLDNMVVTGGSTLFESLIQGVPAITLRGRRWAARSGASVLTTLGHPELIAETIDEYIDKAVELANDIPRITAYRQMLRHNMTHSSLTNIEEFYKNFESAYLDMWADYVKEKCA